MTTFADSLLIAQAPPVAGRAGQAAPAEGVATTEAAPLGAAPGTPAPAPGMDPTLLFVMLGMLVLMFTLSAWTARKEKKKRAELLSSIGRYDRVQTIGGIIGTIVEVKDDEVILKVDENTNTKISFSRSSIQGVLKRGPGSTAADAVKA
jgi:preprotein translocase subunit YajC